MQGLWIVSHVIVERFRCAAASASVGSIRYGAACKKITSIEYSKPRSTISRSRRRWKPAPRLSRRLNNQVLFKREDLQPVFSFKIRGAYNKIAQLSAISAQRGVICASAGNHAQGVALAARTRGIPAVIVMPLTTPEIKVQAVADLGGEIILHGDDYDHAYEHATELAPAEKSGVRASLRRPRCDRRPGHDCHGDLAAAPWR